jgi:hypothetical protein
MGKARHHFQHNDVSCPNPDISRRRTLHELSGLIVFWKYCRLGWEPFWVGAVFDGEYVAVQFSIEFERSSSINGGRLRFVIP